MIDQEASTEALVAALADRYELIRELGRGGMAMVYLAHDRRHNRQVAVKVVLPEIAEAVTSRHFLREIRVVARLQHPHIVPLFDSGVEAGRLFYVMAFEHGESLRDRLQREKQLAVPHALRIAREMADALAYAHAEGVIHRDVKPANILLASGHALLADFGIARTLGDAGEHLTTTGVIFGTPAYMSPEQRLGERNLDGRSDIYSLGCVLYEMLAGMPPYTATNPEALLALQLRGEPTPIRVLRPSLSDELVGILDRALAPLPADRFGNAAELCVALERLELGVTLPGTRSRKRLGGWRGIRFPRWQWLTAVMVALAIIGGVWSFRELNAVPLDPHRVVIFPLSVQSAPVSIRQARMGESAASIIGYTVEGAAPMRWIDVMDHLDEDERARAAELSSGRQRELSRSLHAAYMIDGSIEPRGEGTVTVILRLRSVDGDSTIAQRGADGPATVEAISPLALRALRELLPSLVSPGQRVDVLAFAERDPAAIVLFLQAERAYRDARFADALVAYDEALARDSALAVAALKGAQSASWLTENKHADRLAALAIRHVALLPPRYATYARALQHFLRGEADSSFAIVSQLVADDPGWTDAWFLLGEIANHLVPSLVPPDSLEAFADSAFRATLRTDPDFSAAIGHRVDIAMRRGDLALVDSLTPALLRTLPDSSARWLDAVTRCVRSGPAQVNWSIVRDAGLSGSWGWGSALLFAPAQGGCARAAFRIALTATDAAPNDKWGALLGTFVSLVAAGRDAEAAHLIASPEAEGVEGIALLVLAQSAGADVLGSDDRKRLEELAGSYNSQAGAVLWMLAAWHSTPRDTTALRQIHDVLVARLDDSPYARDSLFAAAVGARLAAQRDTTEAVERLRQLVPHASYQDIIWQPWESFAGERLLLAQLLESRGAYAEAIAVAATHDAPAPIINLIYLRESLRLRERSARAMGEPEQASRYRARLDELGTDRSAYP